MDLELTDEQLLLAESVSTLLTRHAADDGIVPSVRADVTWRELADFGALEVGGDGGLGLVELSLIARELGTRLVPVPYVDTASLAYGMVGSENELDRPSGSIAFCASEPGRSYKPTHPSATLHKGVLSGAKTGVTFARTVDWYAVPAATSTALALAIVAAGTAGITIAEETSIDASLAPGTLQADRTVPRSYLEGPPADELIGRTAVAGAVLVSAEAAGAAATLLVMASDYAGKRRQFGHTIASFQAIRHLLADMYVDVETTWSSVLYAAASLDGRQPDAFKTAAIAKAHASRSTHRVAESALQVFGGIAFTAEHPAHRYLRRIVARKFQYGTPEEHEATLGAGLHGLSVEPVATTA